MPCSDRRRPARRRGGPSRISLALCAGALGAAALIAGALPGGAAGDAGAPESERVLASIEEGTAMRISSIEVAGPARDRDPAVINRLGSAAVPVRLYLPAGAPWATLVWAHGGSFSRGTLDWPEADWVSQRFADAGVRVYSVDYARATETVKAPAPGNDVAAVLRAAAEETGPLVAGGASAGAHLAVLAALAQADLAGSGIARPADALILEYPTLHRAQRADAAIAATTARLPERRRFGAERIAEMYGFYLGDPATAAAAGAVVAGELPPERLALLPPTVIVNADADDLRASGEEFAEQLRDVGVPVVEAVQPGTVHGYLNRPEESDRARADAQETIDRFVRELRGILASERGGGPQIMYSSSR